MAPPIDAAADTYRRRRNAAPETESARRREQQSNAKSVYASLFTINHSLRKLYLRPVFDHRNNSIFGVTS